MTPVGRAAPGRRGQSIHVVLGVVDVELAGGVIRRLSDHLLALAGFVVHHHDGGFAALHTENHFSAGLVVFRLHHALAPSPNWAQGHIDNLRRLVSGF